MPKIVDHDQYRRTLLQQSLDLFAEKGYSSITMRQLAEGLGVSTGTLYHYFPSKENMYLQLVEELTEQDISSFLSQAPAPPSRLERLEAVMDFVIDNLEYFTKQQLLWIDFYQHSHRSNLNLPAILDKLWNRTREALSEYLQTQNSDILDFILIFMDGLVLQQIYGKGGEAWARTQVNLLCQMVAIQLEHAPSVVT
jgi:AcrR family transcriptional regulator